MEKRGIKSDCKVCRERAGPAKGGGLLRISSFGAGNDRGPKLDQKEIERGGADTLEVKGIVLWTH